MKRRDLAKLYFPEMSDVEAVRSLRRWIEGCPKLMSALEELSMPFKKSRNLSARQVRIIMEYLGDPYTWCSSTLRIPSSSALKIGYSYVIRTGCSYDLRILGSYDTRIGCSYDIRMLGSIELMYPNNGQ